MKNFTPHLNRIPVRKAFLLCLSLLLFIYGPVSVFSQIYIVSNTPTGCGGATGEVVFGVNPTPTPNQLTVLSVVRISPNSGVVVNGPITITPASYTLSNLEFGNYYIQTLNNGNLEFTVNDNSYWPYQAQVFFNYDIGTRAFNKDLKVDDNHCIHAAGIFNGPITFYQDFYWPNNFNGYYLVDPY